MMVFLLSFCLFDSRLVDWATPAEPSGRFVPRPGNTSLDTREIGFASILVIPCPRWALPLENESLRDYQTWRPVSMFTWLW
jgi:hypothetical protein